MKKWEKRIPRKIETFQLVFDDNEEPELIHIIKTGFKNRYIVVFEDAYEIMLGYTVILEKEQIEKDFGIKLTI